MTLTTSHCYRAMATNTWWSAPAAPAAAVPMPPAAWLMRSGQRGVLHRASRRGQLAGTVTTGACEESVSSASAMRSWTTVSAYLESKSRSSIQNRKLR